MSASPPPGKVLSRELLDVLIRAGLVFALAVFCFRIFRPFLDLLLWSVILAITFYPLDCNLKRRLGNKDGRAATVIVLLALGVLLVPIYLLGVSLASSAQHAIAVVRDGGFHIPPPSPSIADWPLVGGRLHAVWLQAATDLTSLAQKFAPQLRGASIVLLGKLAALGLGLLMFIAALIIAGIIMTYAQNGQRSAVQIASRVFGADRGPGITALCTSTIRAVALGVVGIAFIQMLLIGVGFVMMGVPGAGLLALVVLLLGIMQIPATLVTLPVIVFVIATQGVSVATIVLSIYVFVAGLVDNVLKPLLLGRGVAVPMPVILVGALGGMIVNGIIGLFIGPVVLAVAYQLFWQWVEDPAQHAARDAALAPVEPP